MNSRQNTLSITPAGLAGSILVLAVAAVCVRLGVWQLDRLGERRAHNAQILARLDAPPVQLTGGVFDTAGIAFHHVAVAGTFDNDHAIVLPGRPYQGVPGVYVLTPLLLDNGAAVLVNRGWLPSADAATVDLQRVRALGPQRFTGLVVPFPRDDRPAPAADSSQAAPAPDSFRQVWFSMDRSALRRQFPYPLLDIMVQALPASDTATFPIRLPPPPLDEGPHLSYAIQWFSFAVIGVVGWIALVLKGREERKRQG